MRHARSYILFSAAPPGQGGEHHINEQPYWREKFERHGFLTFDAVRPAIAGNNKISYWYRYNSLLFIRGELLPEVQNDIRATLLSAGDRIKDSSPVPFRFRKAVIRCLPNAIHHKIARLKSKFLRTSQI